MTDRMTTLVIDPECLACTLCLGPVGPDYRLIRGGAGGVACGNCRAESYCRACDLDMHCCYGCGVPLQHGRSVCAACDET